MGLNVANNARRIEPEPDWSNLHCLAEVCSEIALNKQEQENQRLGKEISRKKKRDSVYKLDYLADAVIASHDQEQENQRLEKERLRNKKRDFVCKLDYLGESCSIVFASHNQEQENQCERRDFVAVVIPDDDDEPECRKIKHKLSAPKNLMEEGDSSAAADDDDDDEWSRKQKPKKQRSNVIIRRPIHHYCHPMPEKFLGKIAQLCGERSIENNKVKLVIEKELYQTDLACGQNRFSMPLKQIISKDFLSKSEKEYLCTRKMNDKKSMNGIEVSVIFPSLQVETLEIRRWEMTTTIQYVLTGKKYHVFANRSSEGLRKGTLVQLWSFRTSNGGLCLALVKLRRTSDLNV